jgi:hypothetical protein
MMDMTVTPVPEIVLKILGEDGKEIKTVTIPMTGLRVTQFFKAARVAVGWTNLRFEQIAQEVEKMVAQLRRIEEMTAAREAGQPMEGEIETGPQQELDFERMIEAVDILLPADIRGALDFHQYRKIWGEAFGITIGKIFFGRTPEKKVESSSESSPGS